MIQNDNYLPLTDKEKASHQFDRCWNCEFHPCELVEEYALAKKNNPNGDLPFHIQEAWGDKCFMRDSVQVECGTAKVSQGIVDDFKVDIRFSWKKERWKIVAGDSTGKWEPKQPIIISAPMGQGKNHFVENVLLPYVRELNIKYGTDHKVLIISNRIALSLQIESRVKKGMLNRDFGQDIAHRYKGYECADVLTYQGLLNKVDQLRETQQSKGSRYLFVICDEAHFFTSDSMFNHDTGKILHAIAHTFADAVRVYMTATPYDCFPYINEYEDKYPVFYHFYRNYSYIDAKYFSEFDELNDIIADSVARDGANWMIFIDNIEKGKQYQSVLETYPALESKVYAIDANSKEDRDYQEMICRERFPKDIKVLIATSVVDNGVNFRNIQNVVVSDISKDKVLQMVGRARIEKGDRITLYLKRFNAQQIENRINFIEGQRDAYHSYNLAYGPKTYSDRFHDKYFNGAQNDWKNAGHWFGRVKDNPTPFKSVPHQYYLNKIARDYVEKLVLRYRSIHEEMRWTDIGQEVTGQKFLECQLSWFGKEYDRENDITLSGRSKSEDGLINLLETNATAGTQMFKDEQDTFRNEFTKLHDGAFVRRDKNKDRSYGLKVINDILDTHSINYRIESHEARTPDGKRQYWVVVRFDKGIDT